MSIHYILQISLGSYNTLHSLHNNYHSLSTGVLHVHSAKSLRKRTLRAILAPAPARGSVKAGAVARVFVETLCGIHSKWFPP